MKSLLILTALCYVAMSCTKAKETAADLVTANVSSVLVKELQCAQGDKVKADIKAGTDKLLNIQAETAKASVSAAFCYTVVEILVLQVVNAGIPTAWECSAADASANVVELAKKGCERSNLNSDRASNPPSL